MTKILMILNQVQAGIGGEEKANIEPGGKTTAIGPGVMMEPFLKEVDAHIAATLFCGDKFFEDNTEEVSAKMVAMINKLQPDVVICGPAFNYNRFADMACSLTKTISEKMDVPVFAAMSVENDAVEKYKNDILILETPKKGGVGLNAALRNMAKLAVKLGNKETVSDKSEFGLF